MKSEKILKKVYTKNDNEIVLIEKQNHSTFQPFNLSTILIIGVVHGDEPQGKFLIENYLQIPRPTGERVGEARVRGQENRLLFIPCLNPDGLKLNTRQNANGVDINRNFAAKNWELGKRNEFFGGESPASEIETRFVQNVIEEFKPDLILTLHAPFKVVNFDGPAEEFAQEISKIINYPVQSDIGYPTPGSFGTYAGIEGNIPTITLELDEEVDIKTLVEPVNEIFDYLANI